MIMTVDFLPKNVSTTHTSWHQARDKQESSLETAMALTSLSMAHTQDRPARQMNISYILADAAQSTFIGRQALETTEWYSPPLSSLIREEKTYESALRGTPSLPLHYPTQQDPVCRLPPMRLNPPAAGYLEPVTCDFPTQSSWNSEESSPQSYQFPIPGWEGRQDSSQQPHQSQVSRIHVPSPSISFRRLSNHKNSSSQRLALRRKPRSSTCVSESSSGSASPSPTFPSLSPRSSYRSSQAPHKHRRASKASHIPHSNKAYPVEQVDWIRYHHDDCNISWAPMFQLFRRIYPIDHRTADQCLSSRYYRDNMVPMVDEHGNLMFDGRGKLKWLQAKVRDRSTPKGRAMCIPYKLVDKHPERALLYDFVSDEDKSKARQIMLGNDPTDPDGKKANWRRIMREAELAGHLPPTA